MKNVISWLDWATLQNEERIDSIDEGFTQYDLMLNEESETALYKRFFEEVSANGERWDYYNDAVEVEVRVGNRWVEMRIDLYERDSDEGYRSTYVTLTEDEQAALWSMHNFRKREQELTGLAERITDFLQTVERTKGIEVVYNLRDNEDEEELMSVNLPHCVKPYTVNVSADSVITAATEVLDLVARKA